MDGKVMLVCCDRERKEVRFIRVLADDTPLTLDMSEEDVVVVANQFGG